MVDAGSAGVFMTMMGVVMGDFWLKNGGHECSFLTGVRDLVPSKPNGHGLWKITKLEGKHWEDGDLIKVVPESVLFTKAFFVHFQPSKGYFSETISMEISRPTFSGAKFNPHYLVGTMASGAEVYAYLLVGAGGGRSIVLQKFDKNGMYWNERPIYSGNVYYRKPADTGLPCLEIMQDDEGSGNEPP